MASGTAHMRVAEHLLCVHAWLVGTGVQVSNYNVLVCVHPCVCSDVHECLRCALRGQRYNLD